MDRQALDWQRVAEEAVRILACGTCRAGSAHGLPQPFWVGEAYRSGGVVLVARNPASKDLPEDATRLLAQLGEQRSPAAFLEWSRWRITHMTATPWRQWQQAFAKAVDGCWRPYQLAWLNVVPAPTESDAAPSAALCDHGQREHLAPMLAEVLRPAAVITRYTAAAKAVLAIPGPWQEGSLFPIDDRFTSNNCTDEIRRSLAGPGLRYRTTPASRQGSNAAVLGALGAGRDAPRATTTGCSSDAAGAGRAHHELCHRSCHSPTPMAGPSYAGRGHPRQATPSGRCGSQLR